MSQTDNVDDAAIVAQIVGGDSAAYEHIMRRYEYKLRRYATYLLHDEAIADDVVQETFIKAYQNLRSYKPAYNFSSWIYRIAHNEAMNYVKRHARHAGVPTDDSMDEMAYDAGMAEGVDLDIAQADVRACLSVLDPKYREVIQLVYFEQMKYEDVGDVLHVPTSTVGVWVSRAKAKLRAICEKRGVHHG